MSQSHCIVNSLVEKIHRQFSEADLFYGHGTDNPLDEAVFLIFTVLDIAFDCDESALHAVVGENDRAKIEDLAQRRINTRKPMAYLLNKAWFCGLPFYVNEQVLIPRSPLAELIQQRFHPWIEPENVHRILDIGTGSACIAIACAYAFPAATVCATDVQTSALEVANKNIRQHRLDDCVQVIQSDLFSRIDQQQFDLIISNPPYVSAEEIAALPAEYNHEPVIGLHADDNGLSLVKQILYTASEYLTKEGLLIVEVGYSQQALIEVMPDVPFFWFEFEQGGEGVFMLSRQQLLTLANE